MRPSWLQLKASTRRLEAENSQTRRAAEINLVYDRYPYTYPVSKGGIGFPARLTTCAICLLERPRKHHCIYSWNSWMKDKRDTYKQSKDSKESKGQREHR